MSKHNPGIFNSRGRLSQTDYAYRTVKMSNPIVAVKSKCEPF